MNDYLKKIAIICGIDKNITFLLIKAFGKDCANFLKRVGKDRTIGAYKVMVRARK